LNIVKKLKGFKALSLSEPRKNNEFCRLGWIVFESAEYLDDALESLNNIMIKNFSLSITKSRTDLKPLKITVKVNNR
jgi:hypothetical protein